MKYFKRIVAAMLSMMLLCGCSGLRDDAISPGSSAPETTSPPSETTSPVPAETTVPPTTIPPTTEPRLYLEPGPAITADGDTLSSESFIYEGIVYVPAGDFLAALDYGSLSGDDASGYTLEWMDGNEYQLLPGHSGIIRNGSTIVPEFPVMTYLDQILVPVMEMCSMLEISVLEDPDSPHLYCTSIVGSWEWEKGVRIPILMYHGVSDQTWGAEELFVSPSDMEAQVKYLVENGYDLITFEDWYHLEDFDKPVMLTFDDGYLDNYEELYPILREYNAKATIFVITTSVDRDPKTMTSAQAKEMMDSGLVSIQSHTFNHPHLSECSAKELEQQMRWSKFAITRMTGYEPFVLCYPYGDSDSEARDITLDYYKFGINMTGGLYTTSDNVDQITRFYVSRTTTLSEFISMVEDAGRS